MSKPIDRHIRQQQIEIRESLNKAFDFGWEACEERIIKLLEEIITERQQVEQTINVLNEISNLRYLIALIKGEK